MNNSVEAILRGGQFKKLIEKAILVIRAKTDLKRVEIEVIFFLARFPAHNTMKDICNHLQMNKGHISTVLDSLHKQGYITEEQDTNDRRYVHYSLTDKASEIVTQVDASWKQMTDRIMEGIPTSDMAVFEQVAGRMGQNIEQMLNDETQWEI